MRYRSGLLWFAGYKLAVFGFALAALAIHAGIWPLSLTHFVGLFFQWDAKHILRVASQGYLAAEPSIQVFPAFPFLIRVVHFLVPHWEWAAMLAAQLASGAAAWGLYRLFRSFLDERDAKASLVAAAIFPTAYFMTLPYSETLFCAFFFSGFAWLKERKHGRAAIAMMGASLTRVAGVWIVPVLGLTWLCERKKWSAEESRRFLGVAGGALVGFFLYLVLNRALYNDWFYFSGASVKHWGVRLSYPFHGFFEAIASWPARSGEERFSVILFEIGFYFLPALALPWLWKTKHTLEFFLVAVTLAILGSMNFWLCRPRYVLPLYPLYAWLGVRMLGTRSTPARMGFYCFASGALFALFFTAYLRAKWAF